MVTKIIIPTNEHPFDGYHKGLILQKAFIFSKTTMLMPSIQKTNAMVMKYDPIWRKFSETKIPEKSVQVQESSKSVSEHLLRLNKVAKGHPFCVMYHTKEHDPL